MKKYLLLSAAALMMFGFAPQASAMDDAHHAGEALVETTAEISADAEAKMEHDEDCATKAMEGDDAAVETEMKDDCASKVEDGQDHPEDHVEEAPVAE